jgi:hypothetical protein
MILFDAGRGAGDSRGVIRVSQGSLRCREKGLNQEAQRTTGDHRGKHSCEAKKCGVESGDPNLRFQPRLPGSVVGEVSMRQVGKGDKITRVTDLW